MNTKLMRTKANALVGRGKTPAQNRSRFRPVPPGAAGKWKLKHILVPIDFSEASRKALRYAVRLAGRTGSRITLLHVIEPVPAYPEMAYPGLTVYPEMVYPATPGAKDWATAARAAFRKLRGEEHVELSLIREELVREGTPHQEITKAALELAADLIIIATNGRTGLAHVLLGSTTERVVRHAPCPVLVVREKEREFLRA